MHAVGVSGPHVCAEDRASRWSAAVGLLYGFIWHRRSPPYADAGYGCGSLSPSVHFSLPSGNSAKDYIPQGPMQPSLVT